MEPSPLLWSKLSGLSDPYPLLNHLVDSGVFAAELFDWWLSPRVRGLLTAALAPGDEEAARRRVAAMVALHDVGKASRYFQRQGRRQRDASSASTEFGGVTWRGLQERFAAVDLSKLPREESYRDGTFFGGDHAFLSSSVLADGVVVGDDLASEFTAALVAGGHHGRYAQHLFYGAETKGVRDAGCEITGWYHEQAAAHRAVILSRFRVSENDFVQPLAGNVTGAVLMLSLVMMVADHLASNEAITGRDRVGEPDVFTASEGYLQVMAGRARTDIATRLGVFKEVNDPLEVLRMEGKAPTDFQLAGGQFASGLFIGSYPPGGGKTLAALARHHALGAERMIFAINTRNTVDAMWEDNLIPLFGGTQDIMEIRYSGADLHEYYQDDSGDTAHGSDFMDAKSRRLLAPVTAATYDQVFAGFLRQPQSHVRSAAALSAHLVFDEVHTMDAYQMEIFRQVLTAAGIAGTPVTLLSATMPSDVIRSYVHAYTGRTEQFHISYPSYVHAGARSDSVPVTSVPVTPRRENRLSIDIRRVQRDQLIVAEAAAVVAAASSGSQIAVIVNTVGRAIELSTVVAETLKDRGVDVDVVTYHSRMTAKHKAAQAAKVRNLAGRGHSAGPRTPVIVIGTQVLETSLDVDFDEMFTELAPVASLIQRSGRLWRWSEHVHGQWSHPEGTTRHGDPVLVVFASETDGTVTPGDALPYRAGQLRRSLAALTTVASSGFLTVPRDVQQLIDLAEPAGSPDGDFTDEEKLAIGSDWQVAQESADVSELGRKASEVVVRYDEGLAAGSPTVRDFYDITEPAEGATGKARTRLIDRPTIDVILIDECSNPAACTCVTEQFAWHGTLEEARSVRRPNTIRADNGDTGDTVRVEHIRRLRSDARQALVDIKLATVAVPGFWGKALRTAGFRPTLNKALGGAYVIPVSDFGYDPERGAISPAPTG